MSDTDLQLLERYARQHSEDAFAEIVRRHLDLVHSAALRQVRSPQLAEEVAQCVFTDLARNAGKLKPDTILTAWLYQVTRRTAIDVVRREARRQLRELIATEMNTMNATAADWTHIEPLLDEAMEALDAPDRAAVLLRFFENKSLREVGATLGTSDDAAQKRVSRAVEHLRDFFAKRGVTVGASGIVVVVSANAVHAAPIGLAAAISSAAVLAGSTIAATATATATKAIAMTTLQKTIVGTALAAAIGAGVFEARQASNLRSKFLALQQQQEPLAAQVLQLKRELDAAAGRLAASAKENNRLSSNSAELLRLRGEVGSLRQEIVRYQYERKELTNQIHFGLPFFSRDDWSEKGTDEPLNTLLTMLWAMKQGDDQKLAQLIYRADASQSLDSFFRLSKKDWERLIGVQIVSLSETQMSMDGSKSMDMANIEVILEKRVPVHDDQTVNDQSTHRWSLLKTNAHWLISGGH